MPRGDGTGPMGQGAMTGRAAGLCAGYNQPGFMNPMPGRGGFGRGRGRGMGMGRGMGWGRFGGYPAVAGPMANPMMGNAPYGQAYGPATSTPEQETQVLKAQAQELETTLASIKKRLDELEASGQDS